MDLIDKYIGEASIKEGKEYIHVVKDKEKEWSVIHSVHDLPSMGGQQIKSFKDGGEALRFAQKLKTKWKKATVSAWAKKGSNKYDEISSYVQANMIHSDILSKTFERDKKRRKEKSWR